MIALDEPSKTAPVEALGQPAPFAKLLRQFGVAVEFTQEGFAERAALSREAISALERGGRQIPQPDTLALLVDALHSTHDDRPTSTGARRRGQAGPALGPRPARPPRPRRPRQRAPPRSMAGRSDPDLSLPRLRGIGPLARREWWRQHGVRRPPPT